MVSKFFAAFFQISLNLASKTTLTFATIRFTSLIWFTCWIYFFARKTRLKPLARVCITHWSDHNDHLPSYLYKDSYLPFDRKNQKLFSFYLLRTVFQSIFSLWVEIFSIYLWTVQSSFHGEFLLPTFYAEHFMPFSHFSWSFYPPLYKGRMAASLLRVRVYFCHFLLPPFVFLYTNFTFWGTINSNIE